MTFVSKHSHGIGDAADQRLRFLVCGDCGMLIECDDLNETLRLFAAVKAAASAAESSACAPITTPTQSATGQSIRIQPVSSPTFNADYPAGVSPNMKGIDSHTSHRADALSAITELIPAARTLFIRFNPLLTTRAELEAAVRGLDTQVDVAHAAHAISIPVTYDGEDLAEVAQMLGLSSEAVIARHCGTPWSVAFVGFAPGFAYLTGGDPCFDVPRRATPRLSVPAGAVGLAGTFSGVYPRPSSGGWQLIGHTDVPMWDDSAKVPALLQPGDTVRFAPVRPQTPIVSGSPASAGASASADSPTNAASPDIAASDTFQRNAASSSTSALIVLRPGILATFQDDGRNAANMGVTGSGAADPIAYHLANALVGNAPGTPAIELTNGGAVIQASGDAVVAVAGAPVDITITGRDGGRPFAICGQEAFLLRDGETMTIGTPTAGLRDYLAVMGGFDVPRMLGSASTDTMSGIGPKPLRAGQTVPIGTGSHAEHTDGRRVTDGNRHCDADPGTRRPSAVSAGVAPREDWPSDLPSPGTTTTLEVTLGPRADWFTDAGLDTLLEQEWLVTAQSNRVGLRLSGEVPLERRDAAELASEATVAGAVEVPTSGQPVIFLRDQPVTGGYPVVAVLTTASLAMAGQLPPGAKVAFRVATTATPARHHMAATSGSDPRPSQNDGTVAPHEFAERTHEQATEASL